MKLQVKAAFLLESPLLPLVENELKRVLVLLTKHVYQQHMATRQSAESCEEATRAPGLGCTPKFAVGVREAVVERVLKGQDGAVWPI